MTDSSTASRFSIRAGRVVCPASGFDGPGTVVIDDGRIVSVEPGADEPGHHDRPQRRFEFPDGIVLPGLIDLHAHPANGGSVFGIEPDRWMLPRGTTTVQSQGDAGADGIDGYIERTVRASRTRVLLSINLSLVGESTEAGCLADPDDADVDRCVDAIERHRNVIRSVSINASHHACGTTDPRDMLRRGIAVAERTGLPVLYGMRRPADWPLAEQLRQLRAGDIVTYCFRREPHCIVEKGRVLPCVREARERGIRFDVGHGMASFSFDVAAAAIADGFEPDTISSDLQQRHAGGTPQHDLPLVMSKLRAAGMPEPRVFAAATRTPAAVLGLSDEAGSLEPGRCGDAVVLDVVTDAMLSDCDGVERTGTQWTPLLTVRAGRIVQGESARAAFSQE